MERQIKTSRELSERLYRGVGQLRPEYFRVVSYWIAQLSEANGFAIDIHLWSSIFNSYATTTELNTATIQRYATASCHIALSLVQGKSPAYIKNWVDISNNAFTEEELTDAIGDIYVSLGGKVLIPSTGYFLRLLVNNDSVYNKALAIANLIHLDRDIHKYLPYDIAQAVLEVVSKNIVTNTGFFVHNLAHSIVYKSKNQSGVNALQRYFHVDFKVLLSDNTTIMPSLETTPIRESSPTGISKFSIKEFNQGRLLGSGSYGSVYKGILAGGEIAIKKQEDNNFTTVLQEIAIACTLKHPNIETVRGFTFDNGNLYFTMAIREMSLDKAIHMDRTREEEQVVRDIIYIKGRRDLLPILEYNIRRTIALDIMRGLEHLHANGVIHSDIKPANILLTENMRAKIADFGSASPYATSIIENQPVRHEACSSWYKPIEHMTIENIKYSYEVDVWAAAIVLLEMETGCLYIDETMFNEAKVKKGITTAYRYAIDRIHNIFGNTGTRDLECIEDQHFKDVCKTMYTYDVTRRYTASQIVKDLEAGYM